MDIGVILLGWGIIILLVVMALMLLVESGVIKISISWEEKDDEEDKKGNETGKGKGSES